MRRLPAPDSVTSPPPSITTREPWSLRTFAVAVMVIVTGAGPHLKVITPPAATALTTAADVQLAGVPVPITWFGCDVSTGRAAAGIEAWPLGFPACRVATGLGLGDGVALAVADGVALVPADTDAGGMLGAVATCGVPEVKAVRGLLPQPAMPSAATVAATSQIRGVRTRGTLGHVPSARPT